MFQEMKIDGISGTTLVGEGIRIDQKPPYFIYQYATDNKHIYYFQNNLMPQNTEFHEYDCRTQSNTVTLPASLIKTSGMLPGSRNTIIKIFPEGLIFSVSDTNDNQWYFAYDFQKKKLQWIDFFPLFKSIGNNATKENQETDVNKCFFQPITFSRVLIRCSESIKNPMYDGPILDRYYRYDRTKNTMETLTQEQVSPFMIQEDIYSPRG